MELLHNCDSATVSTNELTTNLNRYERERQARLHAEALLEQKKLELFHTNQELNKLNENLVSKINELNHALRTSEEKFRGIIENMEFGLLEVDTYGLIVQAYPRFCEMVGYEVEELIGKDAALIFLPKTFLPVLKQQYIDRQQGKGGVYEVQMIKKGGERIWFLFSGTPLFDVNGTMTGSIGIHYDITYSKKLQIALDEARRRAEAAQDAEKQFLANMSHEIRTPLNAIIGMAHLLYDTEPTEEQREFLGILKNSAEILRVLISDVLDLSKIRSGNIEVQKVEMDVVGIVRTLVKSSQLRLEDRPLSIEAHIDPKLHLMVVGDDLLLNQILTNLIGNAEKFTAKGSIDVSVRIKKRHNTRLLLEFTVADTGIGIPKYKHQAIFQTFQQVDGDIKRKFGGTGLGLAITKQLIELQGGAIAVKSRLGRGSVFTFTIPYEASNKVAISETPETLESMSLDLDAVGKTILVVEDNYMNRKYISTLLKKWRIDHDIAHHGKEAFAMARKKPYDLILMDVQMPEMDGYETTIAIRNSQNFNRETPIIALTASALVSQKDRALSVGMNDYLSKPFKPAQLFEKLQSFGQRTAITEGVNTHSSEVEEAVFSYNPRLDKKMLKELYADDLDYAREMFDTFIHKSLPEVALLKRQLSTENWTELGRLAHKLKPSFGMVGLGDMEEKMQCLEDMAKGYPNYIGLYTLLTDFEKELPAAVEAVESDLKKLKKTS
jgi:PAS domain S-box-containing protein